MLASRVDLALADDAKVIEPRLLSAAHVDYPKGASGDASVVLALTIDKEGAVRAVEVVSGDEPFASAAKAAATAFRFSPATRAGAPIVARIRFVAAFTGPREAPRNAEPSAPASPVTPSPHGALEVTIHGEKPPPSVSTLSRTEVRQIPGTFGDPFRAIEILPGVTPLASGLPFFYVRGAPPGNVGYFLDGVRVPYLFHIVIGPSIVNPAMVDKVDLYSGGYPARFGRFAGAIVSAEATAPRDDWHGEGNLRVFDAGAVVEGGFAGGRGTVLVGGRYSYTAALFSLLSPSLKLDYRDAQARVTFDVTPRDRLSLFAFGSYDLLAMVQNKAENVAFGSEFYRLDARYDHKLSNGGHVRFAITGGFDQTTVGVLVQRNVRDVLFGTRVELEEPLAPSLTLRAGLDAQSDRYDADRAKFVDPDDPASITFNSLFPPRADTALGAWADVVWKMTPKFEVVPGLRLDFFRSADASAVSADGRLAVNVDLSRHVRLLHAVGLAHQPPSFLVTIPGLSPGSLKTGLQSSVQSSAGIELSWPEIATATVTFFDDVFLNMNDALSTQLTTSLPTTDIRTLGSAFGMEIYVRRRLSRHVGGFLSYTLARSQRAQDRYTYPSAFDRTHVFNTALAFDFGRGFGAGARFTLYTGAPSLVAQGVHGAQDQRDPPFYRIDLRAEKRWTLGQSRYLSLVAEGFNVTLHKEIIGNQLLGPISIPSLGLEGGF